MKEEENKKLKITHTCMLCCQQIAAPCLDEPICAACCDILEFGYPSFPAYELKNTNSSR
jgi:hypothetical protein